MTSLMKALKIKRKRSHQPNHKKLGCRQKVVTQNIKVLAQLAAEDESAS